LLPALARCLDEAYGLPGADLAPVSGGESALAYRATTADGGRWFVKVAAPDPCYPRDMAETERALRMTAVLRARVGAAEIVAPRPSRAGEPWVALGGGHVAVFPWVDARPLGARAGWPDAALAAVARAVGEIQRSTSALGDLAPARESFTVGYLRRLPAALDGLAGLGAGARTGQRAAAELVLPRRGEFERLLRHHDDLAGRARQRGGPLVLCHTDLNGDNLLLGADGRVYVVDWDEPRLAPPEQDVRYLLDLPRLGLALGTFEEAAGPTALDADVFGMYFHRRVLVDLAHFVCRVLRPDRTDQKDAHDLGIIRSDCLWALEGGVERRIEELRAALEACGR
jgi:spectinomycin phosphotransferase